MGDSRTGRVGGTTRQPQSRCAHGFSSHTPGVAAEEHRSCDSEQRRGSALVPLFLLRGAANREFVRKHPVATKRAFRAILKATDICALEPERAAKTIVDLGFTKEYRYALQTLKECLMQSGGNTIRRTRCAFTL